MKPTNEELWRELEGLIENWDIRGDVRSLDARQKFIDDNSPNDGFRDFAFQHIIESWSIKTATDQIDPMTRYEVLWRLLLYERGFCKSRFLSLDEMADWIFGEWSELLQSRLSLRESSFKNKERFDCAVGFKNYLSSVLILCLGAISTEKSLKILEEMQIICPDIDRADIEEAIENVKIRIKTRST
jgi:hypothetical protein